VQLFIYDIAGRIVNEYDVDKAGFNQIIWDGRNLEGREAVSGVYFYGIRGSGSLISKKMIYLK
jgi:flagellar hook assembly protein FlgD